jgi:hypothetical protein
MCKNEKDSQKLSPTSQAINALLAGEYPGMNVPEVLKIISPEESKDNIQVREKPEVKKKIVIGHDLAPHFSPEELEALNK